MSGHSHWSGIKHKKEITDKKRGKIFSNLAKIIEIAARRGKDPDSNPSLRMAIEKAKSYNLPNENIDRAIKKGTGETKGNQAEEIIYEAYGPNGTPIIIEVLTDNKNRTISEIKHILNICNGKLASEGSVKYLFDKVEGEWKPKYTIDIADQVQKEQLIKLFEALDENDDVNEIYSNINL